MRCVSGGDDQLYVRGVDDDCIAYVHQRTVVKFNFRKAFHRKH